MILQTTNLNRVYLAAGADRNADQRGGLHLHGHSLQLLPQVLREGGGWLGGLQVPRHAHCMYHCLFTEGESELF